MASSTVSTAKTRGSLTADGIVDAAMTLIERDGMAAFTMRSLGRELGVSGMAVYGYFGSRDEVLAAVLERFMGTMNTDPIPGERWDDTLRRTMTSIYRTEMEHPQLASIEVDPQVCDIGLAEHTDKIVNLHLAQGMPEPVLRQAWAIVDAYLTGFSANAIALRSNAAGLTAPGSVELKVTAPDDAPSADADMPAWQRIVTSAYTDEAFAHGVEIIIDGIRALAAPDPCEWYTPDELTR